MFDIESRKITESAWIIEVSGDFFLHNLPLIEEEWNTVVAASPGIIGIDCSRVTMLDSSGIGFLVKMRGLSRDRGFELVFIDISDTVEMVFETTKLRSFFVAMSMNEFNARIG